MRQVSLISTHMLLDAVQAAITVMETQNSDNGEPLVEGNEDLYYELCSVRSTVREAVDARDDLVFPDDPNAELDIANDDPRR